MAGERSFVLPDLGEGLMDAELLSWRVAVGDQVALNQVIAEVETAKAAVELPSPYAGTVLTLHAAQGDTIGVGTPIITFSAQEPRSEPGSDPAAGSDPGSRAEASRVPVLVGYGATAGTGSRRAGRVHAGGSAAPSLETSPAPAAPARPMAKPLVRKLARDRGIELADVPGSGPDGLVTRQDVLDRVAARDQAAASTATPPGAPPAVPPAPRSGREERIPIRGVRRATAQAMVRSAFTAPQATEFVTVDVTATMDLLKRLRASAFVDVKLTPLVFAAKALLSALERNPMLNSSWDEQAQEIVVKHYVNLGIATAAPRGLLVPNLKDAQQFGLIELARELAQLAQKAREGRCATADLSGGTITLTNVGMFGIDTGTPILNPGEAAILCLGAVREQPWVHNGALAVRSVTTLSVSFDHRIVDGEQAARFLAEIAAALTAG